MIFNKLVSGKQRELAADKRRSEGSCCSHVLSIGPRLGVRRPGAALACELPTMLFRRGRFLTPD
jgi:hypothetical protein